jgi:hypothetical protein
MEWSQGGKFIKLGGDQGGSNSYGTIFQRSEKVIKKYAQILHDLIVKVSFQCFPNKKKCIALYCIVLYCLVLCCVVLYCIVLYCIVFYYIVLFCNAKKNLFCNILAQDIAGSC